MREAGTKNKMTRVKGGGGAHAYIPGECLADALEKAGLPRDLATLEMRAYPMKTNWKGQARILIEITAPKAAPQEGL